MANPIDYSKLSDTALEQIASGKPIDYSQLHDDDLHEIIKSAPKPEPKISPLASIGIGERHLGGAGPIAAGAAQAIPDKIMQWLSGPTLSLEGKSPQEIQQALKGKSPTQVNAALKSMGIHGDVGPTTSSQLYEEAKKPEEELYAQSQKQQPLGTGVGSLIGTGLAFEGLGQISPTLMATSKAPEGASLATKALTVGKNIIPHAVNAFIPGAEIAAMESKNRLIGGTPEEAKGLALDTAKGGATASAVVGGLSALAGGLGLAGETKTAKDIKGYYNIGKEGKDLGKVSTQIGDLNAPELVDPVSLHDTQAANNVLDQINKIDDHLGESVGETVKEATANGVTHKADPDAINKIDDLFNKGKAEVAAKQDPEAVPDEDKFDNTRLKKFFDFAKRYTDPSQPGLSSAELQEFRNGLGDFQRRVSFTDPVLAADIRGLVSNLTDDLKSNVMGYKDAAERLSEFRKQVPETILSKDNPVDITKLRLSGTRNSQARLMNQLKSVIRGLNDPKNVTAKGSYTNLLQGLQKFHTDELVRQAKALGENKQVNTVFQNTGVTPDSIADSIKTAATKSKLLQDYTGHNLDLASLAKNPSQIVTKPLGWAANKLGVARSGENAVLNTGKRLYNASSEDLEALAGKLEQIPAQKSLGSALRKAVNSKNSSEKNSILFTLMQNPDTRRIIQSGEFYVGTGD